MARAQGRRDAHGIRLLPRSQQPIGRRPACSACRASQLWYIVDGGIEVDADNDADDDADEPRSQITPGKGGWLGELWDPNEAKDYWEQPHHWLVGFHARAGARVVAFDRKRLHDFIARSPHMRDAAEAAEIADLWGKLRNTHAQATRNVYRAMVEMAHADGELEPDERSAIERFVTKHPRDLLQAEVERAKEGAAAGSEME